MSDELLVEFVAEATEHLAKAEEILLGFGRDPGADDAEAVNACFRSLHTIKGCAGFLDLPRIRHLSHAGEQMLDALRTREAAGSAAVFDALLLTVSRLQDQVAQLDGHAVAIPDTDDDCIRQLEASRSAIPAAPGAAPVAPVAEPAPGGAIAPLELLSTALAELILCGPDDRAGIAGIVDRLAQHMLGGSWNPETRPVMTRMRQLVDGLAGPEATEHFRRLLALGSQLEELQRAAPPPAAGGSAPTPPAPAAPAEASEPRAGSAMGEFIAEADDLLNQAEATVVGRSAFTAEQVNGVFRAFHTVKGMAAYLDQPGIERAAHEREAQIQAVRDGTAPADEAFAATVLAGVDALRELVAVVRRRQATGDRPQPGAAPEPALGMEQEAARGERSETAAARRVVEPDAAAPAADGRPADHPAADGRQQVEKATQVQHQLKAAGDAFSRVATAKLEELMNQVGELLIAQAMVQHNPELQPNSHLAQAVGRQGRILRNLQVLSLSLRMVPLRGTFQKMARVVYDTAKKLGKQVEFTLGGEDTEIDRTLAETMGDPLMHMVRNAVDHGIETPEVRLANGKPAAGRLRLEAFQAGDDVVIRLVDDGAGMDAGRLRAKAIEKGLIPADQPMDEQACFQLVFLPGFSTAARVTDVSGRGVGMDVVRRQVEEASGTVRIDSTVGAGTTFTIRLPMTTAILDAMQLAVGGESLLMPIGSIVEMLRPRTGQVQTMLGRGQVIQHRQRTLPLVRLGDLFGIPGAIVDPAEAILLVIDNHGSDYALQVDGILGQRQVVIKPFDAGVAHHDGTSGTTILGDGRVALILDPAHLVRQHAAAGT